MSDAISDATMDQLEPDQGGTIVRLDGVDGTVRRLMELGLVPGTGVRVVRRAPLGDPIELEVRGVRLALRRSEARLIHVERH
jgi:ferrous iron transport protein A